MKALTLHQPWASLVAVGAKTIETRSWPTKHRGPLAIHASKDSRPCRSMAGQLAGEPLSQEQWDAMPFGAVVAVAELVDVFYIDQLVTRGTHPELVALNADGFPVDHKPVPPEQRPYGDFRPGRWAWMLSNVFALDPPLPARGLQGLWTWRPTERA